MLPQFLVPETIVRESGKGTEFEIPAGETSLLITLGINRIVEQESLDVCITGSADGTTWDPKPLLRFPQKFYCGTYSLLMDLGQAATVTRLRVEYKLNRWGRGRPATAVWLLRFRRESRRRRPPRGGVIATGRTRPGGAQFRISWSPTARNFSVQ